MSEQEPGLVVPFVCVVTAGGPYDDLAFAAGVQYGGLRALLRKHPGQVELTVRTALRHQLDLLAMECGYEVEFECADADFLDEWIFARFKVATA